VIYIFIIYGKGGKIFLRDSLHFASPEKNIFENGREGGEKRKGKTILSCITPSQGKFASSRDARTE